MTEKEREAASAEILEIGKWLVEESGKIFKELINKYGGDLKIDGNAEAYEQMHQEFSRRMRAVKEKYYGN